MGGCQFVMQSIQYHVLLLHTQSHSQQLVWLVLPVLRLDHDQIKSYQPADLWAGFAVNHRSRVCVWWMWGSYLSSVEVGWRRLMSAASCDSPLLPGAGSEPSLGPFHRHRLFPPQCWVHTMEVPVVLWSETQATRKSFQIRQSDLHVPRPPRWLQLGVGRIRKESAAKIYRTLIFSLLGHNSGLK